MATGSRSISMLLVASFFVIVFRNRFLKSFFVIVFCNIFLCSCVVVVFLWDYIKRKLKSFNFFAQ